MALDQLRDLIQDQTGHIDAADPLLERARAVRDDPHHLFHQALIGRELAVPAVEELFDGDGDEAVELQIDLVAARERWEERVERKGGLGRGSGWMGAEHASDQSCGCLVGDVGGDGGLWWWWWFGEGDVLLAGPRRCS